MNILNYFEMTVQQEENGDYKPYKDGKSLNVSFESSVEAIIFAIASAHKCSSQQATILGSIVRAYLDERYNTRS